MPASFSPVAHPLASPPHTHTHSMRAGLCNDCYPRPLFSLHRVHPHAVIVMTIGCQPSLARPGIWTARLIDVMAVDRVLIILRT